MTKALRWCAEVIGVATIAIAASLWWLPIGIAVVGVYLIIIANLESGGTQDARTEERNP